MTEQNSNNSYNNDNNNLFFSQQDISDNNSFRSFNEFANEENNDTNILIWNHLIFLKILKNLGLNIDRIV